MQTRSALAGDYSHFTDEQRGWLVAFSLMAEGQRGIATMASSPARWFARYWDTRPEGIRAAFCRVLLGGDRMIYAAFTWGAMPHDVREVVTGRAGAAAHRMSGAILAAQHLTRAAA